MGETLKEVLEDGGERFGGKEGGQAKVGKGGEAAYTGKGGENQGEGGGDRYSWHGVEQERGLNGEWEAKSNQGDAPLLSDGQMVSADAASSTLAVVLGSGLDCQLLSVRRFNPSMK